MSVCGGGRHYLPPTRLASPDADPHPIMLVLSRVQAFLPQIAASNADITRRAMEDPDSVDIEKVGADSRYIQMVSQCIPMLVHAF